MTSPSVLEEVVRLLRDAGVDLPALGLAWARVLPAVTLIPAFGLRALPMPARAALGLALAASIFPAIGVMDIARSAPWPVLVLEQVLRGVSVAVAAAVPLWAATMAGGLTDTLRGGQGDANSPVVEGKASPLGVLFSILASAIFLSTGGPARVVAILAQENAPAHPVVGAVHDLLGGIVLAISLGAPMLVASIVLEISTALVARAASPAQVHLLMAPLRSFGILAVLALVLDRVAAVMATHLPH